MDGCLLILYMPVKDLIDQNVAQRQVIKGNCGRKEVCILLSSVMSWFAPVPAEEFLWMCLLCSLLCKLRYKWEELNISVTEIRQFLIGDTSVKTLFMPGAVGGTGRRHFSVHCEGCEVLVSVTADCRSSSLSHCSTWCYTVSASSALL